MPAGGGRLFELPFPVRDGSTIMYVLQSEAEWGAYEHSENLKIKISFGGARCRVDMDGQESGSEFG
jgi:hypothetical protein